MISISSISKFSALIANKSTMLLNRLPMITSLAWFVSCLTRTPRWVNPQPMWEHLNNYLELAWEPSLAQGLIVSPTDYPRFVVNYDFNYFFPIKKSIHSIYNLKTNLRTFPWISRISLSKFDANQTRGS